MKRIAILVLGLIGMFQAYGNPPSVPGRMEFCDMEVVLTPDGQDAVQKIVDQLYQNPTYFDKLVSRAQTYMPIIEEALALAGAPDDLKYVAILESHLNGTAVSKSNAVGYWQFKDFTAREVGLEVNAQIDERKHIFKSTLGAARYFQTTYQGFGNWMYALIGYNQGPTGAKQYTDPSWYGVDKMKVDGKMHRYALKSLAYKVAFQTRIKPPAGNSFWLEPVSSGSERSVQKLAERHNLPKEEFLKYNPWIGAELLPGSVPYTYYIPHKDEPVALDLTDPNTDSYLTSGPLATTFTPSTPQNNTYTAMVNGRYKVIHYMEDPDFKEDYVVLQPGESVVDVAVRSGIRTRKLRKWNGLAPGETPGAGSVILVKKPGKVRTHIVEKGDNLGTISARYKIPVKTLRKRNNMKPGQIMVRERQKLYLREKKPINEKVLIVNLPNDEQEKEKWTPKPIQEKSRPSSHRPSVPSSSVSSGTNVNEGTKRVGGTSVRTNASNGVESPKASLDAGINEGRIWHVIKKGETLYSISRRYRTTVEELQRLNDLSDFGIQAGDRLRIRP